VSDQRFATAFKQWHSGLDDGTVLNAQHKVTPGQRVFLTVALDLSVSVPTIKTLKINYLIAQ
jgi:hypothetical protein